jgi:hypothetical protein
LARGITASQPLLPDGMETFESFHSIAIEARTSKLTFSIGAIPSKYIDFSPQWRFSPAAAAAVVVVDVVVVVVAAAAAAVVVDVIIVVAAQSLDNVL